MIREHIDGWRLYCLDPSQPALVNEHPVVAPCRLNDGDTIEYWWDFNEDGLPDGKGWGFQVSGCDQCLPLHQALLPGFLQRWLCLSEEESFDHLRPR